MNWLEEHSGLLVLICSVLIIALLAVIIYAVCDVRKKIASQKINFLGLYEVDPNTHVAYAKLTFGNKSINNLGITELGIKNGGVNIPFTAEFRAQKRLGDTARIIIEPRCAIDLLLDTAMLRKVVFEKNDKKVLKTLRLYAIDVAGTCYQGKAKAVKRLVHELMVADENGVAHIPTVAYQPPVESANTQPAPETPLEELAKAVPEDDNHGFDVPIDLSEETEETVEKVEE
ncbi:MAG: hypothetical protein K2L87_03535 [Clostridiales bacterium]|nr:hypothetical protein [Clostridiales bacterium]